MKLNLLLCLACMACGSVSANHENDSGMGADFTLSVAPDVLTVPSGGTGSATITVASMGSVGDVALSTQNLPAGVTATFDAPIIAAGASTARLTLALGPGAAGGTNQITIVGTAGGTQRTAMLALTTPQKITVSGKVRSGAAGVTVGLVGKPSTTSDASGNFTFSDVTPPYDLYTYASVTCVSTTTKHVIYYSGLTRSDPTISVYPSTCFIAQTLRSATIKGAKSGTGDTTSPVAIVWGNDGGETTSLTTYGTGFGGTWTGAATQNGTLYGLQWTAKANGAPDTFLGYGSAAATLTASGTSTINLTLASVANTAHLSGVIGVPNGFPAPTLQLMQQLGSNAHLMWSTSATTTVDATIPIITGGVSAFSAYSQNGGAYSGFDYPALSATTDVSFTLPAPATLNAPADGASAVGVSTAFQWSAPNNTINQLYIQSTGATFTVFTTASSATIPNVPEAPLLANASSTWSVDGYGPHATIDDVASAAGVLNQAPADFTPGPAHSVTVSVQRAFTTAP